MQSSYEPPYSFVFFLQLNYNTQNIYYCWLAAMSTLNRVYKLEWRQSDT